MTDTVGAVYVRVLADSSDFAKQVRKDVGKDADKAGEAFGKDFDKGVTRSLKQMNLERTLGPQVDRWGRDLAQRMQAATRQGTVVKFKLGDFIDAQELERMSRQLGVTYQQLADFLEHRIPAAARKGFTSLEREMADSLANQQRMSQRYMQWQARTQARYVALAAKADRDAGQRRLRYLQWQARTEAQYVAMAAKARNAADKDSHAMRLRYLNWQWRTELKYIKMARVERSKTKVDRDTSWLSRLIGDTQKMRAAFAGMDRVVDRMYRSLRRMGSGGFFDGITTALGVAVRLSYRLSRALTFGVAAGFVVSGRAISGIGRLVSRLGGLLAKATGWLAKFGNGMARVAARITGTLGGAVSKFGGMISGLGGALAKVGPQIAAAFSNPMVAAGAAIVAFIGALGLLSKVLGILVTFLVDMAGVLSMLVVGLGAAVVAAATLVPIVVSLGLGMAAMVIAGKDAAKAIGAWWKVVNATDPKERAEALKAYNEQLKKLGPNARAAVKAAEPLVTSFRNIRREMSESLFAGMDKSLKRVKPLLKVVRDGLVRISGAIGDVIDGFLDLGKNTAFVNNLKKLFFSAEVVIRNLGAAARDAFAGLVAIFAAIIPQTNELSGGIANIARRFREWAESVEGQESIQQWFSDVWEVAKQVWDLFVALGDVVGAFFTALATGSGGDQTKSFLEDITTKLLDLADQIRTWDEEGKIDQWLSDAKETARQLWLTLQTVGRWMKALNSPENRQWMQNMIVAVRGIIAILRILSAVGSAFIKAAFAPFAPVVGVINGIISAVKRLITWLGRIPEPMVPGGGGKSWASGGVAMGPTRRLIGEAGPEAVIPLTRPLHMVDPSVRPMAAMLRGSRSAEGPGLVDRRTINNWTINTPSPDARVVASQVINRMAAKAG